MTDSVSIRRKDDEEKSQSQSQSQSQVEPHLEQVDWKRDPGLRKLYFWAFIICIASATTGYDS
jgi:hypothetical protein